METVSPLQHATFHCSWENSNETLRIDMSCLHNWKTLFIYWPEMTTPLSGCCRRCPFKRREKKVSLQQRSAVLYISATQVSQSGCSQVQRKVFTYISFTYFILFFLVCIVIYFSNMAEKRAWVRSVILDTLEYAARQHKGSSALPLPIQNAAAEKCFWTLVMYCRQSDFWVARCSFL